MPRRRLRRRQREAQGGETYQDEHGAEPGVNDGVGDAKCERDPTEAGTDGATDILSGEKRVHGWRVVLALVVAAKGRWGEIEAGN